MFNPAVVIALMPMVYAVIEYASTSTTQETSTTTYPPMTLDVWMTSTLPGGETTVWQGPFTQTFSKFWSTLQTPKSGKIGLGDIEGQIGTVRTEPAYPATT